MTIIKNVAQIFPFFKSLNSFSHAFTLKLLSWIDISDVSSGSFAVGACAAPFPQRFFHLPTSSSLPRAYPAGMLLRCCCEADSALTYGPPSAPTKWRHRGHSGSGPPPSRSLQRAPWLTPHGYFSQSQINTFMKECSCIMTAPKRKKFLFSERTEDKREVLPPCGSGACTAAPGALLQSSWCPRDRSGTACCLHSVT